AIEADLLHQAEQVVSSVKPAGAVAAEVEYLMSGEFERPPGALDAGRIDAAGEVTGATPGECRARHDVGKHRRRRDLPFEVRIGVKHIADVIHGRLMALDVPSGM